MPWIAAVGALAGLAQTVVGGIQAKKAREKLENMQVPKATEDKSVSRYYNEALRRYATSPTSTYAYKNMLAGINRNQAAGLNALKDRRGLIGGVSSIVGRSNDATLNAAAMADRDNANRFNQLGNASIRKSADDRYLFGQNQMAPYMKDSTLAGMKAQANAQIMNSGLQNIYSGLGNYAMMKSSMPKQDNGWKRGWSQERADSLVAATPGLSNPVLAYGASYNPNDPYNLPPQ